MSKMLFLTEKKEVSKYRAYMMDNTKLMFSNIKAQILDCKITLLGLISTPFWVTLGKIEWWRTIYCIAK